MKRETEHGGAQGRAANLALSQVPLSQITLSQSALSQGSLPESTLSQSTLSKSPASQITGATSQSALLRHLLENPSNADPAGESVEVSCLVSKNTGAISAKWPTPDGGTVGENLYVGLPKKFDALFASAATDVRGLVVQIRALRGAEASSHELIWADGKFQSAREHALTSLRRCFDELKVGEHRVLKNVETLLQPSTGALVQSFPLPHGGKVGAQFTPGLTLRADERCDLTIHRGNDSFIFTLTALSPDAPSEGRTFHWLAKQPDRYLTTLEYEQSLVRSAYTELAVGESRHVALLSNLVRLKDGMLSSRFPIGPMPSDVLGPKTVRIGRTALRDASLGVSRINRSRFKLSFSATTAAGEAIGSALITDGKTIFTAATVLSAQEREMLLAEETSPRRARISKAHAIAPSIARVFLELKEGESRAVGDAIDLLYPQSATLLQSFPRPRGEDHGPADIATGLGATPENAYLTVQKLSGERYRLHFEERDAAGKALRSSDLYWREGRYLSSKDYLIRELKELLPQLKQGQEIPFGQVNALMILVSGTLRVGFPLPDGTSITECISACGGSKLKNVSLFVTRETDVRYRFRFETERHDGRRGEGRLYFENGETLNQQAWDTRRVRSAFKDTPIGSVVDVGDITSLVNKPGGVLSAVFPTPDGKTLGTQTYFGAPAKLVEVGLAIESTGIDAFTLTFRATKEGSAQVFNPILHWNNAFTSPESEEVKVIRAHIAQLVPGTKTPWFPAGSLVAERKGVLSARLPLPIENRSLGRQLYAGIKDVTGAELQYERTTSGEFRLHLRGAPRTAKSVSNAELVWNGETFLRSHEHHTIRLKEEFSKLREGEEVDLGDITPLIALSPGRLGAPFPRGDFEGSMGLNEAYIGIGEAAESVSVSLKKLPGGAPQYHFTARRNGTEVTAALVWEQGRFISPLSLRAEQIRQSLQALPIGAREAYGDVSPYIDLRNSYLLASFPVPVATYSPARIRPGMTGAGYCELEVERLSDLEYRYYLTYATHKGETENVSTLYWDGAGLYRETRSSSSEHTGPIAFARGRAFERIIRSSMRGIHGSQMQFEPWIELSKVTGEVRSPDFVIPKVLVADAKWGRHGQDLAETVLKYARLQRSLGWSDSPITLVLFDSGRRQEVVQALGDIKELRLNFRLIHYTDLLTHADLAPDIKRDCIDKLAKLRALVSSNDSAGLRAFLNELAQGDAETRDVPGIPLSEELQWQARLKAQALSSPDEFLIACRTLAAQHSPWWEWSYQKRALMTASFLSENVGKLDLPSAVHSGVQSSMLQMYPELKAPTTRGVWERVVLFEKLLRRAAAARVSEEGGDTEQAICEREEALFGYEGINLKRFDVPSALEFLSNKIGGLRRELGSSSATEPIVNSWQPHENVNTTVLAEPQEDTAPSLVLEQQALRAALAIPLMDFTAPDYINRVSAALDSFLATDMSWSEDTHTLRLELLNRATHRVRVWVCDAPHLAARFDFIDDWKTRLSAVSFDNCVERMRSDVGARSLCIDGLKYSGHALAELLERLRDTLTGSLEGAMRRSASDHNDSLAGYGRQTPSSDPSKFTIVG